MKARLLKAHWRRIALVAALVLLPIAAHAAGCCPICIAGCCPFC